MKPRTIERKFREMGAVGNALASALTGTSASEALMLQKALDEQRERIAAGVEGLDCTCDDGQRVYKPGTCPIAIAAAIRSSEIGGEQNATERGERK